MLSRFARPAVCSVLLALVACERSDPPGASPAPSQAPVQAGSPALPAELTKPSASPPSAEPPEAPEEEDKGPWFAITSGTAGVYSAPEFERSLKFGYLRHGERVSVEPEPVSKKSCSSGWYKVRSGGYVCGNFGTTNLDDPGVKFATTAPKLDDVLPYLYVRNAKHGTPLYKSVPSREQMLRYEPYLDKKKSDEKKSDEKKETEKPAAADANPAAASGDDAAAVAAAAAREVRTISVATGADAGALLDPGMVDAGLEEPERKPWWQQENIKDRLHEVTLAQLEEDSDEILAKRMVTGFYVAVDRTFRWNGRLWYKTTRGLITPSERFWQAAGSKFKGVELDGDKIKLPVGWVYGGRKKTSSYKLDGDELKPAATLERFAAVQLTGLFQKIGGTDYAETSEGTFVKRAHLRITDPGPPPADLAPNERWIDVDLDSQTLVAFEGTRPVYATLISSGKKSKDKNKDHSTPTGEWRIREKHITTTMDGDGTAAGDLPYSIEDVPYVLYYHKSYALHGAFWHENYGVQMSHGCVNLAPLDAKHIFFFTDPPLPRGFHGAWATPERPGSRVVVHD